MNGIALIKLCFKKHINSTYLSIDWVDRLIWLENEFYLNFIVPFCRKIIWLLNFVNLLFFFISGDKPHACELCNKKFALACNLRAHMKTHEGRICLYFFCHFWFIYCCLKCIWDETYIEFDILMKMFIENN